MQGQVRARSGVKQAHREHRPYDQTSGQGGADPSGVPVHNVSLYVRKVSGVSGSRSSGLGVPIASLPLTVEPAIDQPRVRVGRDQPAQSGQRLQRQREVVQAVLAIDPHEPTEETGAVELAKYVRELFVLRPEARARTRQTLLHRMQGGRDVWRADVRRLRHACPALASLGSDLLDRIETATPTPKQLPDKPPPRLAANPAGKPTRWPMWLVVFMAASMLRVLRGVANRSSAPDPPTFKKQDFHLRNDNQVPPDALDKMLERQQIKDEDLKKILEKNMRHWQPNKSKDEREATDGKSP